MNPRNGKIESCIFAVAGGLILILGLFPPWIILTPALKVGQADVPERVKLIGHHFIFAPPDPGDYRYAGDLINELLGRPEIRPEQISGTVDEMISKHFRILTDNETTRLTRMTRIDLTRWSVEFVTVVGAATLLGIAVRFRLTSSRELSPSNSGSLEGSEKEVPIG